VSVVDLDTLRKAYRDVVSDSDAIHLSEDRWERLADGELPAEELAAAHDHILSCPQCSDTYRALRILRAEASSFDPGAPEPSLTTGHSAPSRRYLLRGLGLLAVAATVMMVVVLPTFSPDTQDPGANPQVLRSPVELAPATPVAPVDQVVAWQPGPGVVFRWTLDRVAPGVVEILDGDGELIWSSQESTATEMDWPVEITPEPGRYYWRVVVTGAGDKKIASELVAFELSASHP
jgi:hypothetical protein